jgi:uncharacterized protein (DUF1800 family)
MLGLKRPAVSRRLGFLSGIALIGFSLVPAGVAPAAAQALPQALKSGTPAIGVYRKATATFWVDANADKNADMLQAFGQPWDNGLLADITGSGTRVPVIFRDGNWWFDFDGDGIPDKLIAFGQPGDVPLVGDVDGDGKDDLIVYRNGTWYVSTTGDGALSYTYSFSGPSYGDVLWREKATGNLGAYLMNTQGSTWAFIGGSAANWKVVGMGDFNGDGRADIFWREPTTGETGIYYLNGPVATWAYVGGSNPAWDALAVGDFDGDGKADVLWREKATGNVGVWLMNGTVPTWGYTGPQATCWQYAGIGDFNGDGRQDIVWYAPSTNAVAISFMNGASASLGLVTPKGAGWQIVGVGDFNGDGRADILWRETATGNLGVYFMNGTASTWALVGPTSTGWTIQGVRDLNGDGKADILWRETATGSLGIFYMNGAVATWAPAGWGSTAWDIVGVADIGPRTTMKPLVGDVDGDGILDLIVYDAGTWHVSANRSKFVGATYAHGTGAPGEMPIVLDWDGDGVDDLAVVNGTAWSIKSVRNGLFAYDLGVGAAGDNPLYWGNGFVANQRLEAARFLSHATFGPTEQDISNVLQWGYANWIDQQLAIPATQYSVMGWWPQNAPQPPTGTTWPTCTSATYFSGARYDASNPCNCTIGSGTDQCNRDVYTNFELQRQFFVNALAAPDQLRQRVAWALSQIVVTSNAQDPIAYGMRDYQQLLVDNAFGKFEDLLFKVTLNPWMGNYLDMVNNSRSLSATQVPNENYAREIMQLFSIGLWKLNPDGTQVVDGGGNPVPTYTQTDITELARALTGWTYNPLPGVAPSWNRPVNYVGDMIPIEGALNGTGTTNYHDTNAKTVLGVTQPTGTRALADVQWAVKLVASHPNTAPFISKQLIQQLVTSNPSPAYVQRVSTVWTSTGGMLGPVVKAILTDAEALAPENPVTSSVGKLKEPVLAVTSFLRKMGATSDGVAPRGATGPTAMGQNVYNSPTVFNYYSADYVIPGTGLAAPPFNIFDATLYFARANYFYNLTLGAPCDTSSTVCGPAPDTTVLRSIGTKIDYSALKSLAQDPVALVNAVDNLLLFGTLPKAQKVAIANAVNAVTLSVPATQAQLLDRARTAVYLVATSPKFQVEH